MATKKELVKSVVDNLTALPPDLRQKAADMLTGAALALAELNKNKEESK